MHSEIECACGKSLPYVVRDQILKLTFWGTTPCNFVDGHQRFAGNNCSHCQSRSLGRSQSKYLSSLVLWYSHNAYPLNYLIYFTPWHDTFHMLHLDEIPSDHKDRDKMFLYILHTEYKYLRTCTWSGCHIVLISQHFNCMPTSCMYFRI